MTATNRKKWGLGILGIACCFFAIAYVLPTLASSGGEKTKTNCISPQEHRIAAGRAPNGRTWTVTATLKTNGGCDDWLLGMNFSPFGGARGSWRGAWGIPADGHLGAGFTLGAQDDGNAQVHAFSGVAGIRVTKVVLFLGDGSQVVVHPQLPSGALRAKFDWIKNLRYFVSFLPPGNPVKRATVRDANGQVISVVHGQDGAFDGPF